VIMPLFSDQFANARTLADAGAAVVVEPAGLRAAIRDPPAPPPERLAREIRAAPPPLTALRRRRSAHDTGWRHVRRPRGEGPLHPP
jgi:UDP:flavonoid glycosyltransferase YjiC (YdhE family)